MIEDQDFLTEIQNDFLTEAIDMIEQAEESFLAFESNPKNLVIIEKVFQLFHSIKGAAAAVSFTELSQFTHHVEEMLVSLKKMELDVTTDVIDTLLLSSDVLKQYVQLLQRDRTKTLPTGKVIEKIELHLNSLIAPKQDSDQKKEPEVIIPIQEEVEMEDLVSTTPNADITDRAENNTVTETYLKIPLSKIDGLLNLFGEQVIYQSVLEHSNADILGNQELIEKTVIQLGKITSDLQKTAISLRMIAVKNLFSKMKRLVRDTSNEIGKKIDFETVGGETELDKSILDELSGPIMHIVRNSCDHGIEEAKERKKSGKHNIAKITMRAYQRAGSFFIEIEDDGQGLDKEKIKAKAISSGLIEKNQQISDKQIINLIFSSGFSTKEVATNLSGRGVGMDVVNEMIKKLKGKCEITTKRGEGTCVTIQLPLSLSMFNGTIIKVGNNRYVLPNSDYKETVSVKSSAIRNISKDQQVVRIKDTVMNLIPLKTFLSSDYSTTFCSKERDDFLVLITSHNNKDYAVVIDELLSQEKVVLKKLGTEVKSIKGVNGGTILGDGEVTLILNLPDIIQKVTIPNGKKQREKSLIQE